MKAQMPPDMAPAEPPLTIASLAPADLIKLLHEAPSQALERIGRYAIERLLSYTEPHDTGNGEGAQIVDVQGAIEKLLRYTMPARKPEHPACPIPGYAEATDSLGAALAIRRAMGRGLISPTVANEYLDAEQKVFNLEMSTRFKFELFQLREQLADALAANDPEALSKLITERESRPPPRADELVLIERPGSPPFWADLQGNPVQTDLAIWGPDAMEGRRRAVAHKLMQPVERTGQ